MLSVRGYFLCLVCGTDYTAGRPAMAKQGRWQNSALGVDLCWPLRAHVAHVSQGSLA